ncbi:hypothetical protein WR25_04717 [Diploscapter pachys]|uniref:Cytochrome c oxidase assembly protein COX16 homolog, mitochondrial n=1 Tax=Diploscapter pachys TaxID=2018661 RepID=A0A2A2L6B1_9BILA|nr:hypothetical protein WR25_04717 [Diploscapter pachys]
MPKSEWAFLRKGLPFVAIVLGGAYTIHFFQQVRYDFRQVQQQKDNLEKIRSSLEKGGVKEVAELDADNWENVRGPRDNEDNVQYKQAVARQQEIAERKRQDRKKTLLRELEQKQQEQQQQNQG